MYAHAVCRTSFYRQSIHKLFPSCYVRHTTLGKIFTLSWNYLMYKYFVHYICIFFSVQVFYLIWNKKHIRMTNLHCYTLALPDKPSIHHGWKHGKSSIEDRTFLPSKMWLLWYDHIIRTWAGWGTKVPKVMECTGRHRHEWIGWCHATQKGRKKEDCLRNLRNKFIASRWDPKCETVFKRNAQKVA